MVNRNIEIALHCAHQHIGTFLVCSIDSRGLLSITYAHPKVTRKRHERPCASRVVVVKHHQRVTAPTRDIAFVAHRRKVWVTRVSAFSRVRANQ